MHTPRTTLRRFLIAGLAASALAGTIIGATAAPASAGRRAPAPSGFVRIGANAAAAAQPTDSGRTITDLQFFEGSLYSGYGDYGVNTGPIAVTATDPTTGASTQQHVQDTEAIYNHRVLGGKLYTPSIDPRIAADYGVSGPWADVDGVDAVHVFDMNTLTGTDLWMVGSKDLQAAAWRSTDGGVTWVESLVVDPLVPGDFSRFYFAGVLAGKLYVQAFDGASGARPTSMVFDGTSWSAGPALTSGWYTGWRPVEFGGKLVFHGSGHARTAPISTFDGTTVTQIGTGYDIEVAAGSLYLLGETGTVKKTADLRKWSTVGQAPTTARSIASDGQRVVVGTTASDLWRL